MIRRGCEHFPRVIPVLTDLPEAVCEALKRDHPQEAIRKIILNPPQRYHVPGEVTWWRALTFWQRNTPVRTLVFEEDQIVIVEGVLQPELAVYVIPMSALVAVRLVTVLLYAYLELSWIEGEQVQTLRVEFNSVGAAMIGREMDRIRTLIASQVALPEPEFPPDVSLSHMPLKFRNYTRSSLLPGERIYAVVYEPMIRQPGKYLNPYISPNRTFVLTDQHLIILEDASSQMAQSLAASYHIEQCYIPRGQVWNVTFDAQPDVTWMRLQLGSAAVWEEMRLPVLAPRAAALQSALASWLPALTGVGLPEDNASFL